MKGYEVIGVQLSIDVNHMSSFVKEVKGTFEDNISKSTTERKSVIKKELLTFSGSANIFSLIAGRIQLTAALEPYFRILSIKLSELAEILDDQSEGENEEQIKKEILAIINMFDEYLNLIKIEAQDKNGLTNRRWYYINNSPGIQIYNDLSRLVDSMESECKFIKK